MKTHLPLRKLTLIAAALSFVACATIGPSAELVRARNAYAEAQGSPAATLNPADVHDAHVLLVQAEQAEQANPSSIQARHFAYLAERRAELATAQGRTSQARLDVISTNNQVLALRDQLKDRDVANAESAAAQSAAQANQAEAQAQAAQAQANSDQAALAQTQGDLNAEREARAAAEAKADQALAALESTLSVKKDERGTVITLSGAVLFGFNQSTLLPSAERALTNVANVLTQSERNVLVEGHTDSIGSDSYNMSLSEARANAVRDFLISHGVPEGRIRAVGMGKSHPIEDNRTAEGRANNRRVEIILENATVSLK